MPAEPQDMKLNYSEGRASLRRFSEKAPPRVDSGVFPQSC